MRQASSLPRIFMSAQNRYGFMAAIERSHGRQLHRYLSARMRQAADVPDLVQEIFLRLLRIKDHTAIRDPRAYLYTVASHVLHQYMLERSGAPETMNPFEVASRLQSDLVQDPAYEVEMVDRIEKFGRALEQLSPRSYATLMMYRCDGLSLDEIAARLGVSRPMVRKYLARAIAFCDRQLDATE
jgi:RNA polymerase sigma factor (sigma-70 family)